MSAAATSIVSATSGPMRALVILPDVTAPAVLETVPRPVLTQPNDLLISVRAVSTNPADLKARARISARQSTGYDAAGVVVEVGSAVTQFKVGDEVFYAGSRARPGNFAEFHLVDARIVALKPKSRSFAEAAAFPLVSLTAYEALHENMKVESGKSIFIYPGAGGVGSIAIQLAKAAGLRVITSASRPATREWATKLGADIIVDHAKNLEEEFKAHNIPPVDYIFNTYSEKQLPALVPLLAPFGHIVGINGDADIPAAVVGALFFKRATLSFEWMFTRSMSGLEPERQGVILKEIARRLDACELQNIHRQVFEGFNGLVQAQQVQQSGKAIGKLVVQIQ